MNEITVSAKTLNDAITEASIQLGVTSDKMEYDVIEKGNTGFFGIGSRQAVIRAWRKVEKKEPDFDDIKLSAMAEIREEKLDKKVDKEEKASEKKEAREPKENKDNRENRKEFKKDRKKDFNKNRKKDFKKDSRKEYRDPKPSVKEAVETVAPAAPTAPVKEEVKEPRREIEIAVVTEETKKICEAFLGDVLKAMGMEGVEFTSEVDEDGALSIEMKGDNMGILIGKRGQTLDSLQYLTNRVANKSQEGYVRVKLDTEDYRRRRKQTLENLAKNIAYKVKRSRKPVSLEPMNPYERRIIHSALQGDDRVSTHSEGEEPYRRVVITPNRR
ncbi:RNA-binding cell elongation regulator Jag/EloR [Roseburia hominis]